MHFNTRAMVAASSFAIITGKKVAGVYDHSSGKTLKIAAECRGDALRGFDGERGVRFGGRLPELYDAGDEAYVTIQIDGTKASGHDRGTASGYSAEVKDGLVQLYDHAASAWFAYDIQDPDAAQNYHRQTSGQASEGG